MSASAESLAELVAESCEEVLMVRATTWATTRALRVLAAHGKFVIVWESDGFDMLGFWPEQMTPIPAEFALAIQEAGES